MKSMRLTTRAGCAIPSEVPAGHPDDGIHIQLALIQPEVAEVQALGMPQQPCRFVVSGANAVVQ
jgi:hypothetical protein